jgi:DNA-binding phage protein
VGGIQDAEGGSGKAASQEVNSVALTQDFKQTVVDRVRRDPEFAKALLDEAATLFLNGEADTARLVLRDLVNATVGFEALAAETAKSPKSLHRMLSKNGNPTMDNLAAILSLTLANFAGLSAARDPKHRIVLDDLMSAFEHEFHASHVAKGCPTTFHI